MVRKITLLLHCLNFNTIEYNRIEHKRKEGNGTE